MEPQSKALRARMPALLRQGGLRALHAVFPPRCIACGEQVGSDFALCGACWRDTGFLHDSLCCAACGAPLPGSEPGVGADCLGAGDVRDDARADQPDAAQKCTDWLHCDECLRQPRPWGRGRAALLYEGTGRRLVLALKHGDRLDLARPLGLWLARVAGPLITPDTLIAPVPLHRWRLLRRRYNQSALLAHELERLCGGHHIPDLLSRTRATPSQEGLSRPARAANLDGAIEVSARHADMLSGRNVLLVDDVMTSGATLAAATLAALAAGAGSVCVVALARVAKEP